MHEVVRGYRKHVRANMRRLSSSCSPRPMGGQGAASSSAVTWWIHLRVLRVSVSSRNCKSGGSTPERHRFPWNREKCPLPERSR